MNEGPGNLACHCRDTFATGRAGSARGEVGTGSTLLRHRFGQKGALVWVQRSTASCGRGRCAKSIAFTSSATPNWPPIIVGQVQEIAKDALDILNVNNILGSRGLEMADS